MNMKKSYRSQRMNSKNKLKKIWYIQKVEEKAMIKMMSSSNNTKMIRNNYKKNMRIKNKKLQMSMEKTNGVQFILLGK